MPHRRRSPPTGRLTFLFTDIESSTDTWERHPESMTAALRTHDEMSKEIFVRHGGFVFSTAGDGFGVTFERAIDAVTAAIELQRSLQAARFPDGLVIRSRVGIHTGTATEERDGDYFGPEVNRASRVMSVAAGGQVVLSEATRDELTALPDDVAIRDLGHVRLKGVPSPVPIHQLTIEGLRSDFPPIGERPNTTPLFHTSFVGRAAEVTRVRRLLDQHRVVTLLAPGGMGKSRLAAEIGRTASAVHPGGVYFVELADTGPSGVVRLLAETILGNEPLANTTGGDDLLASVTKFVRDRRTLVVLDNCEHVREEVASIVPHLITLCPGVVVLATSRERLGIAAEHRYRLPQLDVVGADGHGAAVELFLERAASVDPDFSPGADELATVTHICQRLEGIPLAIELAASRLGVLSVDEIAARLDDAIVLLRERRSRRPERHRSMTAAIEWSYETLAADEQALFVRLAAFVGGFDLDAATTMAAVAGLDPHDTIDLIQSLIEKSLVVTRRTELGSRYHLLEPIRQFADARLVAAGLQGETWEAHRNHFEQRIALGVPEIDGPPGAEALAKVAADHDNMRAAIDRVATDDPARALSMVSKMSTYWEESGHLAEGADLGIELIDRTDDPITRLKFINLPLAYSTMVGRQHDAERLAAEVIPALPHLPPTLAGLMNFSIGFVDNAAGRYDDCQHRWVEAAEALGGRYPLVARTAALSAAYTATTHGEFDRADELLELATRIDGPQQSWFEDQHLGFRQINESLRGPVLDPGLADSLERFAKLGLRFRTLLMAGGTAVAAFHHGDHALGARAWRLGLGIAREMGHVWAVYLIGEHAAWSAAVDGRVDDAIWIADSLDAIGTAQGWRAHTLAARLRPNYITGDQHTTRPLGTAFDIVAHATRPFRDAGPARVDRTGRT